MRTRTTILAVAASGLLCGAAAGATGLTINGVPDVTPVRSVHSVNAAPAQWTMKDISADNASYLLANVLPYYRVDPPKWCPEDDTCWIGSNADGRTDRQILDSLACNIAESSANYTYGEVPAKDLSHIRNDLCKDAAPMVGPK